jgi:hypothetical protein
MDDKVECGRVERSIDRKRLEDVGLHGCHVEASQAPGREIEDVPVRVEDCDPAAIGKSGSLQEVARARPHIEVRVADVLAVSLDELACRGMPHEPGDESNDHAVVHREQRPRVVTLARIGRVVSIHPADQ